MISCLFHQPALRRHLDDNTELSARAQAHLQTCTSCREMLAAHRAIIGHLSARRVEARDTPAFLHARIMSNLQTPVPNGGPFALRWASAVGVAALIVAALFLSRPEPARQTVATWPAMTITPAFKQSLPENPLEAEIQNLRADTLNAARALASSFLPDSERQRP